MHGEQWQSYENLFIHEVGSTMPISEIAEKLERTERAVTRQASRIGAYIPSRMTGRPWTKPELFLFGRFTDEEIATATGRTIHSVRSKRNALSRASGGSIMPEWTPEEIAMFWRHNNAEIAEITGRSIQEVGDKQLWWNKARNGWLDDNKEAS
ncbi:hypothetical protein RN333_08405 [Enterobacter kobei]|uniref:hypothetical protein n=1 Tax=Enterobacter kobei TaxID=208224 RepID=UPI0028D2B0E7|nr:hypothetical protein [Enterobacter kobei]WNP33625.1 hypothetical protein RN333_16250 [Enterobacter kobei]WNP36208.1 hypothetical protein RN333_08405 [Enterobacter kobei]